MTGRGGGRTRLRVLCGTFLTSVIFAVLGIVALPTPSFADTPACVTRTEFGQATFGMRLPRVQRIFDTRGRFWDGHAGGFTKAYRKCSGGRAYVTYMTWWNGHLVDPPRVAEKLWRVG